MALRLHSALMDRLQQLASGPRRLLRPLLMLVVPFVYVAMHEPGAFTGVVHYGGESGRGAEFNLHFFGAALTVPGSECIALPANYPLYFIKTDKSVMTDHNDIFNQKVRSFVFTVIDDVVRRALAGGVKAARGEGEPPLIAGRQHK